MQVQSIIKENNKLLEKIENLEKVFTTTTTEERHQTPPKNKDNFDERNFSYLSPY